ncbi:TrmH family RNA methyltransferase [Bombilactobacillus thymidiniphilus]|uniref:RNA methyltransferase n=1 Tax=Bombilactobacillus thymidiniphilus TaxID=2923363 RepID=A0ABY4PCW2_9LACO|nr:RNA methyltransferase [Bombilactobacillus thymidiniphilus]UQS83377.1 RNA methyltransferase [Bombilactobacillus thymidiniphilus]
MEYITSVKNNKIKELKKLLTTRGRRKAQKYLLEGEHLIKEALQNNISLNEVYVTTEYLNRDRLHLIRDYFPQAIQITEEVAQVITDTVHPQGLVSVVDMPEQPDLDMSQGRWLLLDEVQDPGNVGTMVRTADAAGLKGVVLSPDAVDLYAPKVQRAMQGSQFHLPILVNDLAETITVMQQHDLIVYGSLVDERAQDYRQVKPQKDWALIMGNEARGMNSALLEKVNANLYIPIFGKAESLNVAVAAGIIIYGLSR